MEKCQRCGEEGEDRRTLWMACFYVMDELDVPFNEVQMRGFVAKKTGVEITPILKIKVPIFEEPSEEDVAKWKSNKEQFFTLRVCKDCRAGWMGAIEKWFHAVRAKESCGSGIFVWENGASVEITEEEFYRRLRT